MHLHAVYNAVHGCSNGSSANDITQGDHPFLGIFQLSADLTEFVYHLVQKVFILLQYLQASFTYLHLRCGNIGSQIRRLTIVGRIATL